MDFALDPVTKETKEIRKYLQTLGGRDRNTVKNAILKILNSTPKDLKPIVHLQLFLHLPYRSEFEEVLDNPGEIVFLIPGFCNKVDLSVKMYIELVIEGDLVPQFLLTVYSLCPFKKFVGVLLQNFLLVQDDFKEQLAPYYSFILTILGKIAARISVDNSEKDLYFNAFKNFLLAFVECDLQKYEKFPLLLQTAGVVWLNSNNLEQCNSEILDLLEEWNYDCTKDFHHTPKLISSVFSLEENTVNELVNWEKVIEEIATAIRKLELVEEEVQSWNSVPKMHKMSFGTYVGTQAFLSKLIFDSFDQPPIDELQYVISLASNYSNYKPKLTREDYEEDIKDFQSFYKVLKRFGDKEKDRAHLLAKFFEFTYEEKYGTKEGLKIAQNYIIPFGSVEAVIRYISSAVNELDSRQGEQLADSVKFLSLKMIYENASVNQHVCQLVHQVFTKGIHSKLEKSHYNIDLNTLCNKVGAIERELKDSELDKYRSEVLVVCMQNPLISVMTLLKESLLSNNFKALKMSEPFLRLKHPVDGTQSLLEFSIAKIIDQSNEHCPVLEALSNEVSSIIREDIISTSDLFYLLKEKIIGALSAKLLFLAKISRMFKIVDTISELVTQEAPVNVSLCENICRFSICHEKFLYSVIKMKTCQDFLAIQSICKDIGRRMCGALEIENIELSPENVEKVQNMTVCEVALIYVRVPEIRPVICKMTSEEIAYLADYDLPLFQTDLVKWVFNVESDEWKAVLDFITKVIVPATSITNSSLVSSLNDCLLKVLLKSFTPLCPEMYQLFCKFYEKAVKILFDTKLTGSDQLSVVETLCTAVICISVHFKKSHKDTTKRIEKSTQQTLLILIDLLNYFDDSEHGNNAEFQEFYKVVKLLPSFTGSSEPIRKCILSNCISKMAKLST